MKLAILIILSVAVALSLTVCLLQKHEINRQTNEIAELQTDLWVAKQYESILDEFANRYYETFQENFELRRKGFSGIPNDHRSLTNEQAAILIEQLKKLPKTRIVIHCWPSSFSQPEATSSLPKPIDTLHLLSGNILYSTIDWYSYPNNKWFAVTDSEFLTQRLYSVLKASGNDVVIAIEALEPKRISGILLTPETANAAPIAKIVHDCIVNSGTTNVEIGDDRGDKDNSGLRIDVAEDK